MSASKATSRISVIGIDLGAETSHLAIVRQGKVVVLQNSEGSRKTPTYVSYQPGEKRLFGAAAENTAGSFAEQTFYNFFKNVGADNSNEELMAALDWNATRYPTTLNTDAQSASGIETPLNVKEIDQKITLTPESLTMTFLKYFHRLAVANANGAPVEDCVIAVPDYWGERERRVLRDVCKAAKWNPLRMVNRSAALAFFYGFFKTITTKHYTMFVDMGHSQTTVSLAAFDATTVKVLGSEYVHTGGADVTQVIVELMLTQLKEKYKIVITDKTTRAYNNVLKRATKVKHVLSANAKAPFAFELLCDVFNVKGEIKRADVEAGVVAKLGDISAAIATVYKLLPEDGKLKSVEVVGGGLRVPAVQTAIQNTVRTLTGDANMKLGKTCDGDESIVRGAALVCATLSTSFKAKKLALIDTNRYEMELVFGDQKEDRLTVFKTGSKLPIILKTNFRRTEDFEVTFNYKTHGNSQQVATAKITGVADKCKELLHVAGSPDPKIEIRVKLDINALVQVTAAQYCERYQKPPKEGEEASTKWFIRRHDLNANVVPTFGLSEEEKKTLLSMEHQFEVLDAKVDKKETAYNNLESYILDMSSRVGDTSKGKLGSFFGAAELETFKSQLLKAEDWMFEVEGGTAADFDSKRGSLEAIGNAVVNRQKEYNLYTDTLEEVSLLLENERKVLEGQAAAVTVQTWLTKELADRKTRPLDQAEDDKQKQAEEQVEVLRNTIKTAKAAAADAPPADEAEAVVADTPEEDAAEVLQLELK